MAISISAILTRSPQITTAVTTPVKTAGVGMMMLPAGAGFNRYVSLFLPAALQLQEQSDPPLAALR